jgi:cyclic pyranopterin phosphate synthase
VELIDPFGRTVRDLRISITDRCNFRCTYCMPAEGMKWLPREEVLTYEELHRVASICVSHFDVDGIRLTGGEPTMRAHFPVLINKLSALHVPATANSPRAGKPIDLAVTTNGATLRLIAQDLHDSGLRRINISLDTLKKQRFLEMTRRDELEHVLDGIDAAIATGFSPVKINVVVQRGINDDEIVDLATFGRNKGVEVRFIEYMPLDADGTWQNSQVVGQDEIVETIAKV